MLLYIIIWDQHVRREYIIVLGNKTDHHNQSYTTNVKMIMNDWHAFWQI